MANVADILGVGPVLEFEGQSYRLSPLTFELQAKFEHWLRHRAVKSAQEDLAARVLTPEDYQATLAGIRRDWAAGIYAFGGTVSVEAVRSVPGVKELLRLSLSKHKPDVDAELVDRMFQSKIDEVNRALAEANADPLAPTPPTSSGAA